MLRLLAPAVQRAELQDVQGLQEPGVQEGRQVQAAHFTAPLEPHAEVVRGRRVFRVREMREAAVLALRRAENEGGLLERAIEEQQSTGSPLEVHQLLPSGVRGSELQDVLCLPRSSVQEEKLQRCRSGAQSEADAEDAG